MSLQPPEEPARDDAERDARASETPQGGGGAVENANEKTPEESAPPQGENTGPSTNRIILWVIVGGIALYLIGSGVYGILVK